MSDAPLEQLILKGITFVVLNNPLSLDMVKQFALPLTVLIVIPFVPDTAVVQFVPPSNEYSQEVNVQLVNVGVITDSSGI